MKYKMGVVGLGVMGSNLARNMERNGFPVVGYDLDQKKVEAFARVSDGKALGVNSPEALMEALEKPRRILIMVPAGAPVDSAIAHLKPHLERGDILIDGGNSLFTDTDRRSEELAAAGFRFVGAGVSGGEEGALWGPSIMPGGPPEAWDAVAPILRAIAARAEDGEPCVAYMGPRGAGHYVKMVHNGIEYADMQLIAECYDLLHRGAGIPAKELSTIFEQWNTRELHSYLIEITAKILARTDEVTGKPLIDMILDEAQQKGTGKWASQNAFDIGAPIPTINAAVESRIISSLKHERTVASKVLPGPATKFRGDKSQLVRDVEAALYAGKIMCYAQGMAMMRIASREYGYNLQPAAIARIWRAGCIIRAELLSRISAAFEANPSLDNLLLDETFRDAVASRQQAWRSVVQTAVGLGVPVPALGASLSYYDAYRSEQLPANLTQAQRDFFGAHTYRRIDREGTFHTEWIEAK
ncbi:MAG TPA: NADP-dependent phosphogluconate dehydrogenase [Candidatus Acidoferrales bacterium]|nr:NADP-dependent phosphogluconate dehydrogenase [Candidatus Acidoferrales bacterium]